MEKKKVCFICCVNDAQYEKECRNYLTQLTVPEGIQMEMQFIKGAASMASGYNEGMRSSDAKYKVYLHQDVFLLNRNFIEDMLKVFADARIGMLGVVGGVRLPKNGMIYSAWNCGRLKTNDSYAAFEITGKENDFPEGIEVEAVDGCLIATQYDLPWREDLLDGWDFYDVSSAMEFRKAGYRIWVPYQKPSWCMHDDGYQSLKDYDHYRAVFLKEYGDWLTGDNIEEKSDFHLELWNTTNEIKASLIQLFDNGEYESVYIFLVQNYEKLARDTELSILRNVMEIWYEEKMMGTDVRFITENASWKEMLFKYQQLKFGLYQMEFQMQNGEKLIKEQIYEHIISAPALVKLLSHNVIEIQKLLYRLAEIYRETGDAQTADIYEKLGISLNKN